ncbi:MAG: hypothetical protein AB2596_20695 [Candidatus Thiodiazotropha sp.]
MKFPAHALSITLIAYITVSAAGCSSEESSSRKRQDDAGVFQGYRERMDKAENVERVIMQADKNRREEMEKNY